MSEIANINLIDIAINFQESKYSIMIENDELNMLNWKHIIHRVTKISWHKKNIKNFKRVFLEMVFLPVTWLFAPKASIIIDNVLNNIVIMRKHAVIYLILLLNNFCCLSRICSLIASPILTRSVGTCPKLPMLPNMHPQYRLAVGVSQLQMLSHMIIYV